jgi:SAM-dependent methyltransferase
VTAAQFQTRRCPVCGDDRRAPLDWAGDVALLRCAACGAIHAASYDDPTSIYQAGYHSGAGGYHLDTTAEPFRAYLRQANQQRLALLESVVPSRGRLLDVGCGTGEFLLAAQARGWQVAGVEPVAQAAATAGAAGLTISTGRLEDVGDDETYDVVSALHVVEHLPDVAATLQALVGRVRPGGHLLVEVPNWRSLHRRRTAGRWPLLAPGEHITHFTPRLIAAAVTAAGAKPRLVRTPSWVGPPQVMSQAWLDLGLPGRPGLTRALSRPGDDIDPAARVPRRVGWAVLRSIDVVWSRARIGMVVVVVAQRRRVP